MAAGERWTRDELLIVLNLYEKIPFGLFDKRQAIIKDVARKLKRTPDSIAMKLGNLASLDPAIKARGRKGLPGASDLDKVVWNEFQANRDTLVPVSEELFRTLFSGSTTDEVEVVKGVGVRCTKMPAAPTGPTESLAQTKIRRGQQFFQQMVLNAFDNSCGVTGIALRPLLVASHILPWRSHPKERLNSQNGICLSRLHDGAFDRGLITFDEDFRLVLSKDLRAAITNRALKEHFADFEGEQLRVPKKGLRPEAEFLAYHREHIFEKLSASKA